MGRKQQNRREPGTDFALTPGCNRARTSRLWGVRRWLLWMVLAGFFLVTACRDVITTTIVHRDGSLDRIITVTGDSSEVFDSTLAIPRDSSWEVIRQGRQEQDSSQFIYSIRKSFRNAVALNREFGAESSDTTRPARRVTLTKRFRWFYTFVTYREVYPQWNQYTFVPMRDYFTGRELQALNNELVDDAADLILSPQDSLALETKFNTWLAKNLFEAIYRTLIAVTMDSPGVGVSPEMLQSARDSVWNVVRDSSDAGTDPDADLVTRVTGRVLDKPAALQEILQAHQEEFETVSEAMDFFGGLHEVPENLRSIGIQPRPEYASNDSNAVEMPGLILDTNAKNVQGNTVGWEIDQGYYFVYDYPMWVESRVVNWWAIVVTALVLVALITGVVFSFVWQRKKQRRVPEK